LFVIESSVPVILGRQHFEHLSGRATSAISSRACASGSGRACG